MSQLKEAGMAQTALGRLQQMIDDLVKERFPEGAIRQVLLLQYGDDPVVEPGEVRVRVLIPKDYEGSWERDHRTMMTEFRRELAESCPKSAGSRSSRMTPTSRTTTSPGGTSAAGAGCAPGAVATSPR
jgi:hypothetical protein